MLFQNYSRYGINISLMLMLALSLVMHKASGAAALVMLLISLAGLWYTREENAPKMEREEWFWVGSTLLFFGLIVLDVLMGHGDISVLDSPSRLVLALPVYFFVRRVGVDLRYLAVGAGIGAILAGGYSYYQQFVQGMGMAQGFTSHIYFGQIALVLTLFTLLSMFTSGNRFLKLFFVAGTVVGFYAVLASGSRGGWVAIPAIMILLLTYNVWSLSFLKRGVLTGVFAAILFSAYQSPYLPVQQRVDSAVENFIAYFEQDRVTTSTGYRLEMWKSAWMVAEESSFLGVGEAGYHAKQQELIDSARVHPGLNGFSAPHSQYFNSLAEQGVVGLISLVLLMIVPLRVGLREMKASRHQNYAAGLVSVTVIAYMDFMLTAETLDRQLMVLIYAFVIAVLYAEIFRFQRVSARSSPHSNL